MLYCDMHCDTLTVCADGGGGLRKNGFQADLERLRRSGCAVQCFAIFTRACAEDEFYRYASFFDDQLAQNADIALPARSFADFVLAAESGRTACVLTAENLGFLGGADGVSRLYAAGVRMASLVWNYFNGLAYPNLCGGKYSREARPLTEAGREVAAALDGHGIIIDVSHLSDGGLEELLRARKRPLVASHSDCRALCPVSRNLTDGQIRGIAGCGGVAGINFCLDFLGGGDAAEGAVLHLKHMINVGGEDCAALGGDLDGMAVQRGMESCSREGALAERLTDIFGFRIARKICKENFIRVFKEIVG